MKMPSCFPFNGDDNLGWKVWISALYIQLTWNGLLTSQWWVSISYMCTLCRSIHVWILNRKVSDHPDIWISLKCTKLTFTIQKDSIDWFSNYIPLIFQTQATGDTKFESIITTLIVKWFNNNEKITLIISWLYLKQSYFFSWV
jgi:hypothetical protein